VTELGTSPTEPPAAAAPPQAAGADAAAGGRKGATDVEQLSRPQALVARRTAESRATVPDATYAVDVDMTEAEALRARLAEADPAGPVPTPGDLALRACALALREHPQANGAYKDGAWERYGRVNLGVVVPDVVATVPTLFDADRRDARALAAERGELEARVRAGTATPPESSGATFTVVDLSDHGVRDFVPVVPLGQAGVLAVGAVEDRPVVRGGAVVAGRTLRLTLACDGRILHAAAAAAFLRSVRERLERPLTLVLPARDAP
jgi:pyruvate dehydrogenase E2 component (dihydrolipoamide acetyltransferase)